MIHSLLGTILPRAMHDVLIAARMHPSLEEGSVEKTTFLVEDLECKQVISLLLSSQAHVNRFTTSIQQPMAAATQPPG
jgi:hypothetical protein